MIMYNDIYEALRKERYSEQLQPMPKRFILDVAEYISEKKKLSQQKGDLFSDEVIKNQKQLENTNSIFRELMLLRKKKILGLIFVASETGISKRDFENMLDLEKELFDKIMVSVQDAEKKVLNQLMSKAFEASFEDELRLVLFLEDIEPLVGLSGEQIGPFKKDEIANIPKKIADILVSDKKAEIVLED